MALFINAGQMRNERRKKEKAIKKKARIMTRTNIIMERQIQSVILMPDVVPVKALWIQRIELLQF